MTDQGKTSESRKDALLERYDNNRRLAVTDTNLFTWTSKLLGSPDLARVAKPSLNAATCILMEWNVAFAKSIFSGNPIDIKAVISSATTPNALAVEGVNDRRWVVITIGLMNLIHGQSDEIGENLICCFPEMFVKGTIGYRLINSKPVTKDFSTMLGTFMYFAGISFFISHELGHHLGGHMPVFGAHAHSIDVQVSEKGKILSAEDSQALERHADRLGVAGTAFAIVHLLKRELYKSATDKDLKEVDYLVAILLSAGIPMAHVLLNPVSVDWSAAKNKKHPPHLCRLANMRFVVRRSLDNLKLTAPDRRYEICYRGFKTVIGEENMSNLIELELSNELKEYNDRLDAAFFALKSRLKPLINWDYGDKILELVNGKVKK